MNPQPFTWETYADIHCTITKKERNSINKNNETQPQLIQRKWLLSYSPSIAQHVWQIILIKIIWTNVYLDGKKMRAKYKINPSCALPHKQKKHKSMCCTNLPLDTNHRPLVHTPFASILQNQVVLQTKPHEASTILHSQAECSEVNEILEYVHLACQHLVHWNDIK